MSNTGLKLALRHPAIVLIEIAWRWSFGLASIVLALVAWFRFAASLTVTPEDLAALHSERPTLMAVAVLHIFQGTGPRLLLMALILLPALCLLWWIAASLGRALTLQKISAASGAFEATGPNLRAVFTIHLLRVFFALAALAASLCAIILASFASAAVSADPEQPNLLLYFLVLLLTLPPISIVWGTLNWYLSLAPWYCVRNGEKALSAISRARAAARTHRRALFGISFGYGAVRLVSLAGLIIFTAFIAGIFSSAGGWKPALVITIAATLVYFALADFLYLARLAAYVSVLQSKNAEDLAVAAP